ncbi:glycine zipper 2TM domain-containing protein [Paucibacter sp. DJ1R-11]|uniref:glycine zipper 2TM domain-containing protein n=1 Tax=Paucibacter sp. DJ1R-11 TaxID=2893556 RepID=UPI0021E48543|nr:glycine zipper 2TM domain-containing protein [Paucibacter sp. DJ1R-11]MCV2364438.1 glycine zipper 2TM domain-containing protein [Paucibacter sp. DJ1R-11]
MRKMRKIPTGWGRLLRLLPTGALVLSLAACAGMSQRERDMAVGAGVGAVGGAVLTGGSTVGTVGGAAVGAIVGSEIDRNKKRERKQPPPVQDVE